VCLLTPRPRDAKHLNPNTETTCTPLRAPRTARGTLAVCIRDERRMRESACCRAPPPPTKSHARSMLMVGGCTRSPASMHAHTASPWSLRMQPCAPPDRTRWRGSGDTHPTPARAQTYLAAAFACTRAHAHTLMVSKAENSSRTSTTRSDARILGTTVTAVGAVGRTLSTTRRTHACVVVGQGFLAAWVLSPRVVPRVILLF